MLARSATPFQILWTLGVALDAAYYLASPYDLPRILTLAACAAVLWRSSSRAFAAVLAMNVVDFFVASPLTTNHTFTAMVCSGLLLLLGAWRPPAPDRPSPAVVVMPLILAVYLASVVQKLNTTYLFDLDASCAVELFRQFVDVPGRLAATLPALSLVAEAGIGIGMVLPRTRAATAVFGTLFHLAVGINPSAPIYLFSMTMIALYSAAWSTGPPLLPTLARLAFVAALLGPFARQAGHGVEAAILGWGAWLTVVPFALQLFATHPPDRTPPWPSARPWLVVAALTLPLLNIVPAYTGDRQGNSYDMYSNLLVDEHGSNHLLLGSLATRRPFSERVRVVESEPPRPFAMSTDYGQLVARVELVRTLRSGLVDRVVWTDDEGRHSWERGQPLPDEGIGWWHLKTRRLSHWPTEASCTDCQSCQLRRPPSATADRAPGDGS